MYISHGRISLAVCQHLKKKTNEIGNLVILSIKVQPHILVLVFLGESDVPTDPLIYGLSHGVLKSSREAAIVYQLTY